MEAPIKTNLRPRADWGLSQAMRKQKNKHGGKNVNTGPTIPGYGDDTSHMGMPLSMSSYMPQDTSQDPSMLFPNGSGQLEMETWGPKTANTLDHTPF